VANLSARKADYRRFQALNIQILGISPNNPFSQKVMADSLQLPYPLLSDVYLKVIKAYGVLCTSASAMCDPRFEGLLPLRSFFLVDKQGIVRGKWIGEGMAVFPSEVLLKGAQEVAQKP
jgi:peroxiredoxin